MSDLRIHAALSPRVAVLSSPDVDRVIQLNGIPDFPTLLRPFESSVERLSVRTSQLETRICDRFPLRFDPYSLFNPDAARAISSSHSQLPPPRPSAVGRSNEELLDRVNHLIATKIKRWDAQVPRPSSSALPAPTPDPTEAAEEEEGDKVREQVLDETLQKLQRGSLEETAPWFAAVQQLVFGQRTLTKHESFGHPVAVLSAVSSASPDPMNDFAKLYEATSQASPFPAHPYINPDTLKYYVLIHDVRTSGSDFTSSKEILDTVKKTYGLHCCMLAINSATEDRVSAPPNLAALWTPYLPILSTSPTIAASPKPDSVPSDVASALDEEDVKRIKGFIRELTAQSIVPFMERYVQHMGDHLANSRKGLTNRFFGASRKLFGGVASSSDKSSASSTSGALATSGGYDPQHEFYPSHSIEAQTRRLADFAFTIRDYKLAASMYDLGRKDFAGDRAWRHAAGATEMFGLSHLMIMYTSRTAPTDVDSYLAQACQDYSTRSSAGLEENSALRATLMYYEAYRMLNYLRPAPAGLLRMANHSEEVLAPLLLEQAALACLQLKPRPNLRKFALYLVTAGHRYQSCGQKVLSLRCYAQAAVVYRQKGWTLIENHIEHELGMQAYNEGDPDSAVAHLLKLIRPTGDSRNDHEEYLKAVLTAYKYSDQRTRLSLPWPVFDAESAKLRFVPESSASATGAVEEEVWERLERELSENGLGERTMSDGSKQKRKRPTSQTSTQARQVPVGQTFWLEVSVRNPLGTDLIIDGIKPVLLVEGSQLLSDNSLDLEDSGRVILAPFEHRTVRIAIRVLSEAKSLRVGCIDFNLAEAIRLTQPLEKKGKRLNGTKEQRTSVMYGSDLSLVVSVHAPRPTLTARILDSPKEVFVGEEMSLKVVLKNEGRTSIEDLRALCDQPEAATFSQIDTEEERMGNTLDPAPPEVVLEGTLEAGAEAEVELLVRPLRPGSLRLAWLLPFSSSDGETYVSRLALHTLVSPSVQLSVETRPRRSKECTHQVVVEATNQSTRPVSLECISVLSPFWKLDSAPGEVVKGALIGPMQSWRGQFLISPAVNGGTGWEEGLHFTANKLQDLLLSRDSRRSPPPEVELHRSSSESTQMSGLHQEGRKAFRLATLAAAFPTLSSRERVGAFTLWDARELDLSLHFSARSRRGRVTVYELTPGPLRSSIRSITHPTLSNDTSKIRSLYAETVKQKATVLQNILTSRLGQEQNPTVVHVEKMDEERYRFVVRNFSDRYEVKVQLQLEGEGWAGRTTLRASLRPGEVKEVEAKRRDEEGMRVKYAVVSESFLPSTGDANGDESRVGRYVEYY